MKKKHILILSYSHLHKDPRILRQIKAYIENYTITTIAYSKSGLENFYYTIYKEPHFSLKRKLRRVIEFFIFRDYKKYYFDDFKKTLINDHINNKYDLIIANDIQTLPLAIAISNSSKKVYFDAHEYHPEQFNNSLYWRIKDKPYVAFLCKNYIPLADYFTTVNESIAKAYFDYLNIKPKVINNAADFHQLKANQINPSNIRLIHHGAAVLGRNLERIIDVMKYLDDKYTLDIFLAGNKTYIKKLIEYSQGINNVSVLPPIDKDKIITVSNNYDIGIYILPPTNFNSKYALPNKVFEYMQARLALVVSPNPEMKNFVLNNGLGICSVDYTSKALASAIKGLSLDDVINFKNASNNKSMELSNENNFLKLKEIATFLLG